jgi:hypothetical protein
VITGFDAGQGLCLSVALTCVWRKCRFESPHRRQAALWELGSRRPPLCSEGLTSEKQKLTKRRLKGVPSRPWGPRANASTIRKTLINTRAITSLRTADVEKFLRDVMAGKSYQAGPRKGCTECMHAVSGLIRLNSTNTSP